jgi:sugar/nucleoside kinase (ribokinase family)
MMLTLGGSSAILAHNLAALGSRVGFLSRIGDDPLGQIALDRLAVSGADVSKLSRASGSMTGLSVILQRDAGRQILTYPGTIFDLRFEDLDLEYLAASRHFHLSSFPSTPMTIQTTGGRAG